MSKNIKNILQGQVTEAKEREKESKVNAKI